MDLGLNGRVAIVGGAGRDIGRHIALALAAEGARVSICAQNEEGLRRTELEIASIGSQQRVLAMPADMSEPRDIRRVVRDTYNRFGQIDIVVIRSGNPPHHLGTESTDEDISEEVEKNLLSAVRFSREVIPYMQQEHWGRIVHLEIPSSRQVASGDSHVISRQLYLIGYFKTLSRELAPFNITVNSLLAGPVATQELQHLLEKRSQEESASLSELTRETSKGIPMRRLGKPEEIGDLVAFLASERAGYLTGASINLDGGQSW